jgi:hypothetical protein
MCVDAETAASAGFGAQVIALDGSASVTLSISGETEIIDKMEGKFLPKGTPYTEPFDDVILEETVLDDANNQGTIVYNLPVGKLTAGKIYNVAFDGITYPVKAYIGEGGMIVLGSGVMKGHYTYDVPYANVPFLINIYPPAYAQMVGGNALIVFASGFEPTTIAIRGGKTVALIDEVCLPLGSKPLILKLTKEREGVYTSNLPQNAIAAAVLSQQPVWVYVYGDENDISWFPMSGSKSAIYHFDGNKYYVYTWNTDGTVKRTSKTITTT